VQGRPKNTTTLLGGMTHYIRRDDSQVKLGRGIRWAMLNNTLWKQVLLFSRTLGKWAPIPIPRVNLLGIGKVLWPIENGKHSPKLNKLTYPMGLGGLEGPCHTHHPLKVVRWGSQLSLGLILAQVESTLWTSVGVKYMFQMYL
jgi:hypothetical protein